MKTHIAELEAFKKKVQDDQAREAAKVQEQIDALEDKEYKKILDETKNSMQKERDQVEEEEKTKKTLEYINSFSQSDKKAEAAKAVKTGDKGMEEAD